MARPSPAGAAAPCRPARGRLPLSMRTIALPGRRGGSGSRRLSGCGDNRIRTPHSRSVARCLSRDFPCEAAVRLRVPQSRLTYNQSGVGRAAGPGATAESGDWPSWRRVTAFWLCHGHTRPVAGTLERLLFHQVGIGFGLSRSIRLRISSNNRRGIATSAIWNTT